MKEEIKSGVVVSKEIAVAEIERWANARRLGANKREKYKRTLEDLACYIEEGTLSLDENNAFIHKLKFPIEAEIPTTELKYKNRMTADDGIECTKHTTGEGSDVVLCYVSHLTGKVKGVIRKLDSEDYSVCQAIATFFL